MKTLNEFMMGPALQDVSFFRRYKVEGKNPGELVYKYDYRELLGCYLYLSLCNAKLHLFLGPLPSGPYRANYGNLDTDQKSAAITALKDFLRLTKNRISPEDEITLFGYDTLMIQSLLPTFDEMGYYCNLGGSFYTIKKK